MSQKPIEKGSFVQHEPHPEYGVGRVVAIGAFATRVLFPHGGLRVFRVGDTDQLKTAATPLPADLEVLAAKEALMLRGVFDPPVGANPSPPEPVAARKPRKKKPAAN